MNRLQKLLIPLLILTILVSGFLVDIKPVNAVAWLSTDWTYRKSFTISRASGAVTDYQMLLTIGYGSISSLNSLKYTGLGTTSTEAPYDDVTWLNPTNIYSNNDVDATVTGATFDINAYSYLLKASTFNYAIPTGCIIKGIVVEIEQAANPGSAIDALVQLTKDGTTGIGDNKADADVWTSSRTNSIYGSATDLWGTTWTPEEINTSTFGVKFAAQAKTNDTDIYVDYIRITVYYQYRIYLDSLCQTDFDDIRVTNSDGLTLMDYWVESVTNSDNEAIWIELDSIDTGATTFYVYYGNAAATAQYATNLLAGAATFIAFENFEWGGDADALSTSGGSLTWSITVAGTSKAEIDTAQYYSGSRSARLYRDGTNPAWASIPYTASSGEYSIRVRVRKDTNARYDIWHGDGSNCCHNKYDTNELLYYYAPPSTATSTGKSITVNTWTLFEFNNINFTAGTYDMYHANLIAKSGAGMETSANGTNIIQFFNYAGTSECWFDDFIVRNYRATEPAWGSWGSIENRPSGKSWGYILGW